MATKHYYLIDQAVLDDWVGFLESMGNQENGVAFLKGLTAFDPNVIWVPTSVAKAIRDFETYIKQYGEYHGEQEYDIQGAYAAVRS